MTTSVGVPFRGLPESTIVRLVAYLIPAGVGGFFVYDGLRGGLGLAFAKGLVGLAITVWLIKRGDILGCFGALERLRTRPEEVVWAFQKTLTTIGRYGSSKDLSLMIGFSDGKLYGWKLDRPLVESPEIRTFLAGLPNATVGHSPELDARFAMSPATLSQRGAR
jgi:hypothetical protein